MVKVLIDYGHGGSDPGAVKGNRYESHDVFRIGKKIVAKLKQAGITVGETRTDDSFVSLESRANMSNSGNYDLFVSLHRNSAANMSATGMETFVWRKVSSMELNLANKVQSKVASIGFVDRGVKEGDFYVIRETYCPAVLIEMGFILNDEDNRIFDTKQEALVTIIVDSILEVLQVTPCSKNQYHEVQKGQTLYTISKTYQTTVEQLFAWNNLENADLIYPGQKLRVG
ncbi:N-acetylmuramoyl-L-alanine amidase [Vagococcus fluvialis]|uniref:N-acetylmuramoyl-L-alanine amidase family protein n=1 Tax=Vagococcus fluvialis TaxID=2738 RepID=UPI003B5BE1B9